MAGQCRRRLPSMTKYELETTVPLSKFQLIVLSTNRERLLLLNLESGRSRTMQHQSLRAHSRLAAVQRNILVHSYLNVSSQRYGTTRMQLQRMPALRPLCRWSNACCARQQGRLWADSGHGAHVHEWQQCADSELCKPSLSMASAGKPRCDAATTSRPSPSLQLPIVIERKLKTQKFRFALNSQL